MPSAGNEWIQLKNSLFNCNASNALPSFLMGFTPASKSASIDHHPLLRLLWQTAEGNNDSGVFVVSEIGTAERQSLHLLKSTKKSPNL